MHITQVLVGITVLIVAAQAPFWILEHSDPTIPGIAILSTLLGVFLLAIGILILCARPTR